MISRTETAISGHRGAPGAEGRFARLLAGAATVLSMGAGFVVLFLVLTISEASAEEVDGPNNTSSSPSETTDSQTEADDGGTSATTADQPSPTPTDQVETTTEADPVDTTGSEPVDTTAVDPVEEIRDGDQTAYLPDSVSSDGSASIDSGVSSGDSTEPDAADVDSSTGQSGSTSSPGVTTPDEQTATAPTSQMPVQPTNSSADLLPPQPGGLSVLTPACQVASGVAGRSNLQRACDDVNRAAGQLAAGVLDGAASLPAHLDDTVAVTTDTIAAVADTTAAVTGTDNPVSELLDRVVHVATTATAPVTTIVQDVASPVVETAADSVTEAVTDDGNSTPVVGPASDGTTAFPDEGVADETPDDLVAAIADPIVSATTPAGPAAAVQAPASSRAWPLAMLDKAPGDTRVPSATAVGHRSTDMFAVAAPASPQGQSGLDLHGGNSAPASGSGADLGKVVVDLLVLPGKPTDAENAADAWVMPESLASDPGHSPD